jgi:phosphoserine phosphatase
VLSNANIGAFLDIDGTLLPAPSLEWRFAAYLVARDEIRGANIIRWLVHSAATRLRTPRVALEANKSFLAHVRESVVADWEKSLAADSPVATTLPLFGEGIDRIFWHLAPLARVIAKHFRGAVGVCATELEVRDGRWTGRLAGEHLSGAAKVRAIRSLARKHDLLLARSYAYGNDVADGPMLDAVGHAVAVNPSKHLARVAIDRGWLMRHWTRVLALHGYSNMRLLSAERAQ